MFYVLIPLCSPWVSCSKNDQMRSTHLNRLILLSLCRLTLILQMLLHLHTHSEEVSSESHHMETPHSSAAIEDSSFVLIRKITHWANVDVNLLSQLRCFSALSQTQFHKYISFLLEVSPGLELLQLLSSILEPVYSKFKLCKVLRTTGLPW